MFSNVEHYRHLEGLELADQNCESSDGSIDLPIGSDYYQSVVTGETIGGERGPVAVSSKAIVLLQWVSYTL